MGIGKAVNDLLRTTGVEDDEAIPFTDFVTGKIPEREYLPAHAHLTLLQRRWTNQGEALNVYFKLHRKIARISSRAHQHTAGIPLLDPSSMSIPNSMSIHAHSAAQRFPPEEVEILPKRSVKQHDLVRGFHTILRSPRAYMSDHYRMFYFVLLEESPVSAPRNLSFVSDGTSHSVFSHASCR